MATRSPSRARGHRHAEGHLSHRTGWLRAGVLGANDGLLSTGALLVGVASSGASRPILAASGVAAMVAGAASMAVGEFASVSSQRDAEHADLARESAELVETPRAELIELTQIYVRRGLSPELAHDVAVELTEHDALGAHARDELGLDPDDLARPGQAATTSAASFALGALVPLLVTLVIGASLRVACLIVVTLAGLAALGAIGARLGGAEPVRPAVRVVLGGAAALAVTALVGTLFDVSVA